MRKGDPGNPEILGTCSSALVAEAIKHPRDCGAFKREKKDFRVTTLHDSEQRAEIRNQKDERRKMKDER